MSENTLDRIISERREKAAALRSRGSDPFRNDKTPTISLAELRSRYASTKPVAAPADKGIVPIDEQVHRVAGRVMAKRRKGKLAFAPISDGAGDVQLFLKADQLAEYDELLPLLDIG